MALRRVVLAVLLGAVPALGPAEPAGGHLVLVGGGSRPAAVDARIVELAGGADATLLVVPVAHPDPGAAGPALVAELIAAGAGRVEVLDLEVPDADRWENHRRVDQASGIFLSGGDQAELAVALRGTELLERIRRLHRRGGVVAGTSAGATALGDLMILGPAEPNQDPDRAVAAIRAGSLAIEPGLDLLSGVIVDQHFLARRRHNRLLTAVLENPGRLGIGIDEATAIVVGPRGRFEVLGEGQVIVYDLAGAGVAEAKDGALLSASDVVLHLLTGGQRFDLGTRRLEP